MPDTVNKQDLFGLLRKHGWRPDRVEGDKQIFAHEDGRRYRSAILPREITKDSAASILEGMRIVTPAPNGHKAPADVIVAARNSAPKGKRGSAKVAAGGAKPGTFGHRLFEARVAAGISQGQLAREVGCNQAQISTWERGNSSPFAEDGHIPFKSTIPIMARLAERFGWLDIIDKTGRAPALTAKEAAEVEAARPAPVEIPEPILGLKEDETSELALALIELRKRHPDERAFARLLKPSDIMQWVIDMETRVRNAELAVAKYERADIGALRRKAQQVDAIKAKMGDLMKQMQDLEAD